jgi:FtsP/CotA-like multicopper oxidase with cupredoxin domain
VTLPNPVRGLGAALSRTSPLSRQHGDPSAAADAGRTTTTTTTRRRFLKYGAAGITTAAGASLAGDRLWPATARAADPAPQDLRITEGDRRMIDGTPVFMRGFDRVPNTSIPLVPGPAIGTGGVNDGTVATVTENQIVTLRITNGLADDHAFAIPDVVRPVRIPGTPPGKQPVPVTVKFTAPRAGTYFYFDPLPAQSVLGLHGVMVVMPAGVNNLPYLNRPDLPSPPSFTYQYVWVLHDVDPVWGFRARARTLIAADGTIRPDVPEFLPRYFTINGVSGEESDENPRTRVVIRRPGTSSGPQPDASLIRIVNMGAATHSCHFHGNHVFVITENRLAVERTDLGKPIAPEKDVIRMRPQSVKDMLIPGHIPLNQYPPYQFATAYENEYPMHCHAEMSQTAGGGNYPSGMLADWTLIGGIPGRRPFA